MFYETRNSLSADLVKIERGVDFSFPAHMHSSFELITVTEGEMEVTVDGNTYQLGELDALLIFPHQTHSFATKGTSKHFLCIFSTKLVSAFDNLHASSIPTDSRMKLSKEVLDRLERMSNAESVIGVKGALYSICADFDMQRSSAGRRDYDGDLMHKIIDFVKYHYKEECSLAALSQYTSYHYAYLSKFFRERFGVSFTEYVNRYRISKACYLLGNGREAVLNIALDSGYATLRSFNRSFKAVMGMTPTEYRSKLTSMN